MAHEPRGGGKGRNKKPKGPKSRGGCRYLMVLILPPFSRAHNARIVVRTGASSSPSCIHIQLQRVNTYVNIVSGVSLSSSMRSMSFTTNAPGSASRYRERRVGDRWTNRIRTGSPIASHGDSVQLRHPEALRGYECSLKLCVEVIPPPGREAFDTQGLKSSIPHPQKSS